MKCLTGFTEEERKVLLWRGGKREYISNADKLYICYHHHSKLGTIFEKRFTKCCDLFKTHKQIVKGGHKFHYSWQPNLLITGMNVFPVGSFVGHAMIMHKKIEKNVVNEMSPSENESTQINTLDLMTTDYSTSDMDSDEARKQSRDSLNTQHTKASQSVLCKARGKPLPASTTEKVQLFYEDDAHSRLMPGKKDFVSIKKKSTSKSDCFYATFMSCMYPSKNRTQN